MGLAEMGYLFTEMINFARELKSAADAERRLKKDRNAYERHKTANLPEVYYKMPEDDHRRAFLAIFKLADEDGDGHLSVSEHKYFKRYVLRAYQMGRDLEYSDKEFIQANGDSDDECATQGTEETDGTKSEELESKISREIAWE